MQSKGIRFCLQLGKMSTIFHKEFIDLKWLPVSAGFRQCVILFAFKFINSICPYYLNEFFVFEPEGNISLRNNFFKLKRPFPNRNTAQKALSFTGSLLWNLIQKTLEKADNLNTIKHKVKEKNYLFP